MSNDKHATVRECVYEIAQLAHIGPTSDDPCAIIRTIDRLANIADAALSGTDAETEGTDAVERPENLDVPLAADTLADIRSLVQLIFGAADSQGCSDIANGCNIIHRKIDVALRALGEQP